MKATIQIKLDRHVKKIILFGAKYYYFWPNFGNTTGITVSVINVCGEYKKLCGEVLLPNGHNDGYGSFLLDCGKYDLQIVNINGKNVSIDPYKEIYTLPEINGTTLDIEIVKKVR